MHFRNYFSICDHFKKDINDIFKTATKPPVKTDCLLTDIRLSVIECELEQAHKDRNEGECARMGAEYNWYFCKRPFFNVFPYIEEKLLNLNADILLSEVFLPFPSIEVRTTTRTMLFSHHPDGFICIDQSIDGSFVAIEFPRHLNSGDVVSTYRRRGEGDALALLCIGVCMIAKDASLVTPVLLNKHRKESMTPSEIAEYAAKAAKRTGKSGFDVGRKMEKMKATSHYRNGCFAKYYVGKNHECYPANGSLEKVPVIKWRSGAIVNATNTPRIPTGFKDLKIEESGAPNNGT